jgi:DHA1 family inner membrane transport protein
MKLNLPLLALAAGAFGIGVTEFAPMGLLPVIATDLGVSIPTAGLLISAYALGVMLGAPLMTLTTGRVPRRTLLIGLVGIFTVGNLLSAVSGDYGMLLIARIVTSLNHGAFFGVGSVVAARLVAPNRRAGAVAAMFMGLTIANVIGVPLATWAGDVLGWRASFWGIAGIGAVVMAALRLTLPALPAPAGGDVLTELRVLTRGPVLAALALTVIGSSAMFTVFTYIAPILKEQTHASLGFVTAMLVTYGLGLTLGNWLGGRFADRSVDRTLIVTLAALAVLLVAFAVLMPFAAPSAVVIFLWGVASFALVPPLQVRVMTAAADAPNLASAVNIGAFNLGNAIGAALGGAVIAGGLGLPAVSLAGAAAAGAGLVLALSREADKAAATRQRRPEAASFLRRLALGMASHSPCRPPILRPDPFDARQDLKDAPRVGGRMRPKDAATLILFRDGASGPEVLMGRRAPGHVFMASKWVFPGGRVERGDFTAASTGALTEAARLEAEVPGPPRPRPGHGRHPRDLRGDRHDAGAARSGRLRRRRLARVPGRGRPARPVGPDLCRPRHHPAGPHAPLRRPLLHGRGLGPADARTHRRVGRTGRDRLDAAGRGPHAGTAGHHPDGAGRGAERRADPFRIAPFVRFVRGAHLITRD